MLYIPIGAQSFGLQTPSWGTTRPAAANGTSITPGTANYGSWAKVGSNLAYDCYGLLINFNSGYTSAIGRSILCDIGVDPAGGTSFTTAISDLIAGSCDTYASGGRTGGGVWYYFPLFIKAGSGVGARAWGTTATAFRCGIIFLHQPFEPAQVRVGSFVETLGAHSQPAGVTVVAGTTAEGSWTSIGTTTKQCWWWQVGLQVAASDTSWNAGTMHVDLAVGDGANKVPIITDLQVLMSASEASSNPPVSVGCEWKVPAGSTLYVRAQYSGTLDTYNCLVYGLGG